MKYFLAAIFGYSCLLILALALAKLVDFLVDLKLRKKAEAKMRNEARTQNMSPQTQKPLGFTDNAYKPTNSSKPPETLHQKREVNSLPKDVQIKALELEAYHLIIGTESVINAKLNGFIIGHPTARLDLSIYIFFEIYRSLCSAEHKKLLTHFNDTFIAQLTKFYNTVYRLDIDFISEMFNNRIDRYEDTLANNPKNPDFLEDIVQFVEKDIHGEPLTGPMLIESIDKHFQICAEVTSIYDLAIKSMMSTIRTLHQLNA